MPTEIYLDNNATTHLTDDVREAMLEAVAGRYGNASSTHRSGERARRAIAASRQSVAELLGGSAENVFFGSGATELNYWVLIDTCVTRRTGHLVTSVIEHSSVLETAAHLESQGVRVTQVPVSEDGRVDVDALSDAICEDTSLVSIHWVNNETGVIQPVDAIAKICELKGVAFHCDASQAVGKLPVNVSDTSISFLTCSAHKMHGPTGIGALYVREPKSLRPLLRGGSQEGGLRPGTENTVGIAGFGSAAAEKSKSLATHIAKITALRDRFEQQVLDAIPGVTVNGCTDHRVCNTTNLHFANVDGEALVALLDREGIRCSQSSACTSNRPEPSYVLRAMGLSEEEAFASVRFSFSNQNTMAEVETAAAKLASIVARLSGFQSTPSQSEHLQGAAKHEV